MPYLLNVSPRAERDLAMIYAAINAEYSEAAFDWFNGLERALLTLEKSPTRCPKIPEDSHLRHLLYGKKRNVYRVIFRIDERRQEVDILHIRHGARGRFPTGDLK
jgi:toxin ParE1/3/4